MKAAYITSYGGPEVMKVVDDAPRPEPEAGQVLVHVRAAALNPFDIKVREGLVRSMAELEFPAILGGDVAGVVAVVGEGVDGFTVGQEVYGQANALGGNGSFAEYTPVRADQLASKPKSIDFNMAAALPLAATSAYQALVDHMGLQAGQKILIHGGAGGIGSLAIQIAHHLGAYVASTASTDNLEFIKNLGADEAIDYTTTDFANVVKDFDAVYDTVGGETYRKSFTVLRPGGVLVSMIGPVDEALAEQHEVHAIAQFTQTTTERLNKIAELVDAGALQVQIDRAFPISEVSDAFEHLKNGRPRGKVVITVSE